jgi:hypothetical protein
MSLKMRKVMSVGLQLAVLAVMATGIVVSASPLDGQLNIAGVAVVSLLGADFVPPAGGGQGDILILPGANTGDFSVFNAGFNSGTLDDRTEADQPVGVPIMPPIVDWMEIPGFTFTLEFISPGSFTGAECFTLPAAAQQTCTPPPFDPDGPGPQGPVTSPYNLTNFTDDDGVLSSVATFAVNGTVTDLNTMETGTFTGTFNAGFKGIPYQTLLTQILAGGSINAPFVAQFDVASAPGEIPEPSSMALGLGGLVLVGAGLLRRRRA